MSRSNFASSDPNTIRILVVGESRVGKTLLIRRLCHEMTLSHGDHAESSPLDKQWGPTIGFDVEVLTRHTVLPSTTHAQDYPTETYNSAVHSTNNTTYQRRSSSFYPSRPNFECSSGSLYVPTHNPLMVAPHSGTARVQTHSAVIQVVELHELGGTRSFGKECRLPLQLIHYDGIMFVYDRANTGSTTYLSEWYREMKSLFSEPIDKALSDGSNVKKGSAAPAGGSSNFRMPKIILVGTQLTPLTMDFLGFVGSSNCRASDNDAAAEVRDEVLVNPAALFEAQRGKEERKHFWQRVSIFQRISSLVSSISIFLSLLMNPSMLLSVQYQEERSPRFSCALKGFEWWARIAVGLERIALYVMAVVLFGIHQEMVSLSQPTVRSTLNQIREDPLCVTQAHICYLYDSYAFKTSVDEVLHFFNILHAQKLDRFVGMPQ